MTTPSTPPKPAITPPTLKGIDIYHGDPIPSFHDIKASGVDFVFIKATQGLHYVDPNYADNYKRAKSVGLIVGAYHFFDKSDPEGQARHFVETAKLQPGDLTHALDVETEFAAVGSRALICAVKIKSMVGKLPRIYSGQSFYHDHLQRYFPASAYKLWIARYGKKPDIPCAFWQYTDAGRTPGASRPLDTDTFYGTMADLKKLCL